MKTVLKRGLCFIVAAFLGVAIFSHVSLIAKASNGVDDFVNRCYKVAFQRDADKGGFEYWKGEIESKKRTGVDVVYNFIFSEEYENQHTSDTQFVKDLYTMFMGREPDQGGYDYWCGLMAEGKSRKDIFTGFANSSEFHDTCTNYGITAGYYTDEIPLEQLSQVNLFVARMYETTLGRLGDQEGQKFWVENLVNGNLTGISCAVNFIKSEEFESQDLTQEDYLDKCYEAFMGRGSDEAGKAYWMEQMQSGNMSRDEVFAGFANSDEFQSICDVYNIDGGEYTATVTDDEHKYDEEIREERIDDENGGYHIDKYVNDILYSSIGYFNSGAKSYEIKYNRKGNPVKRTDFESDGAVYLSRFYEYDANEKLISDKTFYADGKPAAWTLFDRYDDGKTQKLTHYMDGQLKTVMEYDTNEALVKKTEYSSDKIQYLCVYKYFDNGDSWVFEYTYFANGNVKTLTWKNQDGKLLSMSDYYENGKLRRETEYKEDGSSDGWEYIYYDNGNKQFSKCFVGVVTIQWNEHYENGNIKIQTDFYEEGEKIKKTTTFDESGNMTGYQTYAYHDGGHTITYYYPSGVVDSISEVDEKGLVYDSVFYDENGVKTGTSSHEYPENGEMILSLYDEAGKLKEIWYYKDTTYMYVNYVEYYNSDGTKTNTIYYN